jgi:hypothetical protein
MSRTSFWRVYIYEMISSFKLYWWQGWLSFLIQAIDSSRIQHVPTSPNGSSAICSSQNYFLERSPALIIGLLQGTVYHCISWKSSWVPLQQYNGIFTCAHAWPFRGTRPDLCHCVAPKRFVSVDGKLTNRKLNLPSGKHSKNYGKSLFLMGKLTISMAMFNSFLYVYQAGYVEI